MQVPRAQVRRFGAIVASIALAATFVGTASAQVAPAVTCTRVAPTITFSPTVLAMPPSGAPAYVQVTISDVDTPGCTAFQTFDWQWQPKKIAGGPGITAAVVSNSGAAILPGQKATALIRVYGFAPAGSTARFSFTVSRQDKPSLTPATAYFGVVIASTPR